MTAILTVVACEKSKTGININTINANLWIFFICPKIKIMILIWLD